MTTPIQPAITFRGLATTLEITPRQFTLPPNYTWTLSANGEYRDSGEKAMNLAQWDNWGKTQTDEEYQLSCIAANLGLTRA